MLTRHIALVALALALVTVTASAQAPRTVPFIAVDGVVGVGRNPVRSGPTFYESVHAPVGRLGVALRLGSPGRFRPVATLDYSGMLARGGDDVSCEIAPNNTCKERFPDMSGVAIGVGARGAMGPILSVGVSGGIGRYRIGARSNTGYHAEAELALRFAKHAGVVLGVRHVETQKFQGARMWHRPVTVGLRIQ